VFFYVRIDTEHWVIFR